MLGACRHVLCIIPVVPEKVRKKIVFRDYKYLQYPRISKASKRKKKKLKEVRAITRPENFAWRHLKNERPDVSPLPYTRTLFGL